MLTLLRMYLILQNLHISPINTLQSKESLDQVGHLHSGNYGRTRIIIASTEPSGSTVTN